MGPTIKSLHNLFSNQKQEEMLESAPAQIFFLLPPTAPHSRRATVISYPLLSYPAVLAVSLTPSPKSPTKFFWLYPSIFLFIKGDLAFLRWYMLKLIQI